MNKEVLPPYLFGLVSINARCLWRRWFMIDKIVNKLSGRKPFLMDRENYLVSAVLLPLVEEKNGTSLLFEVRSRHLERQPGEICFPGGRVEANEMEAPARTAVREAAEELGLERDNIRLIAPLDFLVTPMGAVVYPYVGSVHCPGGIKPNREEVGSVFTVPLDYLLDYKPVSGIVDVATRYPEDFPFHRVPEVYRTVGWKKRWSFPTFIYEYENYFIWGLTAIILHHFLDAIR